MPATNARKKSGSGSLFSFSCRCRDAKSVSISASTSGSSEISPDILRPPRYVSSSSGDTRTSVSLSLAERMRVHDDGSKHTTSLRALLWELKELEQSVKAWGGGRQMPAETGEEELWKYRRHRRSSMGKVEDSVAIVKETENPLRDFRISMLQMIVEKEIVGMVELRELLQRFLSVNSPRHHDVILLAFSEIWAEVFSDLPTVSKST
ncbi:transcription repressor OFP8-like [Phalaenopsis equestris]|uniref:transcription repressor OFP8-like n=1 Tax=Phalaenopsis equestris TaxID=78828 RepID=UPI0009E5BB78|nr:transcription repressor OFP8-like [Phalaenopsis equestris]